MGRERKVVFAVASTGSDLYAARARVAVASLRLSNPGVAVVLACDDETERALRGAAHPLLDEVDDRMMVRALSGDLRLRSRFVKTRLRSVLSGPFLYLDADVVVRRDLSEILNADADVAGVRNHNGATRAEQLRPGGLVASTIAAMRWQVSPDVYLNGGVLFFNDTPLARQAGEEWHRLWMSGLAERGDYRDQAALNAALFAAQPAVAVLPDGWNAQIRAAPRAARDANVWHYYGSEDEALHDTEFDLLARDLMRGCCLDYSSIARLLKRKHPWRRRTVIDDCAAAVVMRRNRFAGWPAIWLRREVGTHLRRVVRERLLQTRRRAFGQP
jgi:hypothetical protein